MKLFRKLRHPSAAVALAGFAVAGVIGFVHNVQPDPGYIGGLAPIHQTDPNYSGGHAPGMVTEARGIPDPTYVGGIAPGAAVSSFDSLDPTRTY